MNVRVTFKKSRYKTYTYYVHVKDYIEKNISYRNEIEISKLDCKERATCIRNERIQINVY